MREVIIDSVRDAKVGCFLCHYNTRDALLAVNLKMAHNSRVSIWSLQKLNENQINKLKISAKEMKNE
jgi:hypothetical protein